MGYLWHDEPTQREKCKKQGKMFSCISDMQRKKIKAFKTFYLDLYFCGQHDNAFNLLPMCGT